MFADCSSGLSAYGIDFLKKMMTAINNAAAAANKMIFLAKLFFTLHEGTNFSTPCAAAHFGLLGVQPSGEIQR